MDTKPASVAADTDFEKFRLRTFVDRLIELDEVESHDEPVALTGLSAIIEATPKAVLFKKAGPEQVEMIAKAKIQCLNVENRGRRSPGPGSSPVRRFAPSDTTPRGPVRTAV